MIQWPEVAGANGYEVHWSKDRDLSCRDQTLVSIVPPGQNQFYFDPKLFQHMPVEFLVVRPIWPQIDQSKSQAVKR
ncbi:MAG: hypothetical protein IPG71_07180 [bacterium]|nr:hypothetical protein [bacterium]